MEGCAYNQGIRMYNFKPIKQPRVSEAVFDQLKQTILLRHFKPGDKLPSERKLSEQFQVSRIAIRQAVRALETSGFVVTRLGSTGGTYVTDLTFEALSGAFFDYFLADKISLLEIHKVRLLIDPEIGRLAASQMTPEYRDRLQEARKAENSPEDMALGAMSTRVRIHYVLAEMCGNRFLETMAKLIIGMSGKIIEAFKTEPNPFHPPGSHLPIIDAVLAGDPETAAEAMRRHAVEVSENLAKLEKAYRRKIELEVAENRA
jgi:GntR family transcriptional regulator, transcriptional repressor for pyruvate dehydrogenase complex